MVARIIDHPVYAGVIPTPYNPDPVLLAIVQTIRDGLIRDQHVRLHNFGTFRLRWSKERRIKHPKTGEYIIAPPAPKITFTPAKHLRELIEPNPKPVIPLNEPVNLSTNANQQSNKNEPALDEREQEEHSLKETVQDIIDAEYNPDNTLSNTITTTTDNTGNTENPERSKNNSNNNVNKKLGLGLLAAVPLILLMLQADFTPESTVTTTNETKITLASQQHSDDNVSSKKIIRTEISVSAKTQEITQPTLHSNPVTTARPEPTLKPFYLSPQLHTVEKGDNLWSLAKEFYGDALLWPHIYRANTRTLTDPDVITEGRQLIIPGLQQAPEALSVNDKNLITEGYFRVYQLNKAKNSPQAIYFLIGAKQYSFDWLKQNRQHIPRKDWKVIETTTAQ